MKLIGVDIGGTKCAVVCGNYDLLSGVMTISGKIRFDTETDKGPEQALQKLYTAIDKIVSDEGLIFQDFAAIGISCGGPLDSNRGIITAPPNLPGWENMPITEMIGNRFGIRAFLMNDANACALAEWRFGAGRGKKNIIYLTFGTGIGAGLILDGRSYNGTNGMAGEVGHIRMEKYGPVGYGKTGSFEGFCSGGGIAQLAKTMTLEKLQSNQKVSFCPSKDCLDGLTTEKIAEAARSGDALANDIIKTSGTYLGKGLAILMDILDPEVIMIGSIFGRIKDLIWQEVSEEIRREALEPARSNCVITCPGLGEQIGDYAALTVALENIEVYDER